MSSTKSQESSKLAKHNWGLAQEAVSCTLLSEKSDTHISNYLFINANTLSYIAVKKLCFC
jgi:hypothetical protein